MMRKLFGSEWLYLFVVIICLSQYLRHIDAVECGYCGKDFKSLGRHVWRCKQKVPLDDVVTIGNHANAGMPEELEIPEHSLANTNREIEPTNDPPDIRTETDEVVSECICYCGKVCNGLRGLQAHKRACRILDIPDMKALFEEGLQDVNDVNELNDDGDDNDQHEILEKNLRLNGVKLPSSIQEWELANDYFKTSFPYADDIIDINEYVCNFQKAIYSYFHDNYGEAKKKSANEDCHKFDHYKVMSNRKLKQSLRNLKNSDDPNNEEITFVAKLLRSKLNKSQNTDYETAFDHELKFRKDYWKYCKSTFEPTERIKPETTEDDCYKYFLEKLKSKNKHKKFKIPGWMKKLNSPSVDMDLSAPRYDEIASIVKKMRASASPCPFDQVSIIVFKKCPILRTILWRIILTSWESKTIASVWKIGLTVLAYKKGSVNDLENFRPITLQSVMMKVMTSWIRNRTYKFLASNKFIDEKLQKGFWSGVSGTVEHTESLSYIINQARNKQKSVCITLIDLRNAFGEVHHGLIKEVLNFHHLPIEMSKFILDIYNDFTISIATDSFITTPIRVQRGVLQGDSLSPLLFNMCFNTLMLIVDQQKIKCSGYIFGNTLSPRNWLQFADDTSIITALESDNQLLLNLFTKWCVWADFLVRIDKCHTFGVRKVRTLSQQYLPYLLVTGERIPPVDIGGSFVYLGKSFDFEMSNKEAKHEIMESLEENISKTDSLPLHPGSKIKIVTGYIYSKIKWNLSCYTFDITWLKQSCDSLILRFVRKWLNFHPGANTVHLAFPLKKLGLNLSFPSHVYSHCKVNVRNILRNSKDLNIRRLYVETHLRNVNSDLLVEEGQKKAQGNALQQKSACKKLLKAQTENEIWGLFVQLKKQNIIVKFLLDVCTSSSITAWNKVANNLPKNIFSFLRRALILALPTNKNLKTWNLIPTETCPLCNGSVHTQHHILNNCSAAANQHRYLWRHNSVLNTIVYYLMSILDGSMKLYVDIPGYLPPEDLFISGSRPDIVLETSSCIYVLELTVCFETNLLKSREYKVDRYKDLEKNRCSTGKPCKLLFIEFSALGFYSKEIKPFKDFLKSFKLNQSRILEKCSETCIRSSYYIFNRRNKVWTLPELLLFY